MIISKERVNNYQLTIKPMARGNNIAYLGTVGNKQLNHSREAKPNRKDGLPSAK